MTEIAFAVVSLLFALWLWLDDRRAPHDVPPKPVLRPDAKYCPCCGGPVRPVAKDDTDIEARIAAILRSVRSTGPHDRQKR